MSENDKVIQCYHCGNETLMLMISEHKQDFYDDYWGYYKYRTYLCPVCKKITLYEIYCDEFQLTCDQSGDPIEDPTERILYPQTTFDYSGIPTQVASAYAAALKCRNIDHAICLMALRRTLEVVCLDKKASGRDLWRKI